MDRFQIESLRNELVRRGITLTRAAELTGISYEKLQQCFNGSRELTATELIVIIDTVKIPIESLIYKEPEQRGVKSVEWEEGTVMTKEYALTMLEAMACFLRKLYYFPNEKPFSEEASYVERMQELNGLIEFIKARCEE